MSSWAALKARAGALSPRMSNVPEDERNGDDERKPLKFAGQDGPETGGGCLPEWARRSRAVPIYHRHLISIAANSCIHCCASGHGHPPDVEAAAAASSAEKRLCGLPVPVLAGLAYCTASASMVLLNKFALSSFDFRSITMLLLFQCIFCVVAVFATSLLGLIKLEVRSPCTLPFVICQVPLRGVTTVHVMMLD